MNIAKIKVQARDGWQKVETLIENAIGEQFSFRDDMLYRIQLQSGEMLLCESRHLPVDGEGTVCNKPFHTEFYKKHVGDLYIKAHRFQEVEVNIAEGEMFTINVNDGKPELEFNFVRPDEIKDMVVQDDIKHFVKKKEIKDVVRQADIEDVVRANEIVGMVKESDIEDVVRKAEITDVARQYQLLGLVHEDTIQDVVRTADIEDVVRTANITDVVRKNEIVGMVKENQIADVVRKNEIEDVVRQSEIADVVRANEIADVVRANEITEFVKPDALSDFVVNAQIANMARKEDLMGLVKADQIQDVVRQSEIQDVVRANEIVGMVKSNQIQDVVREADIQDVVRNADIEDVVRQQAIVNMVKKADIEGMVKADELAIKLNTKADKQELIKAVEVLATKEELAEAINGHEGFATNEALGKVEAKLEEKADKEDLEAKADKGDYIEYVGFGEGRKTMQMRNHDNISGIATDGVGHNLVMLSKWDVADFGAVGVHCNLNTKDTVTINDNDVVATTKDIEEAVSVLATKEELAEATGGHEGFATKESLSEVVANVELKADKTELVALVKAEEIADVVRANELEAKLEEKADKVSSVAYKEFGEGRKTIEIANHNTISGLATDGIGHNLVMLSKWDVADFGAVGVHCNLNTKDTVTINDDKVVATVEDIENAIVELASKEEVEKAVIKCASKEDVNLIEATLKFIKSKLDYEPKVMTEVIVEPLNVVEETQDIIVKGDMLATAEQTSTIKCNAISIQNNEITNTKLAITAEKDIEMKDVVINGAYTSNKGTVVSLNKADHVLIKDMVLTPSSAYNGIEIGLGDSTIKSVTIDNCRFEGKYNNNAISIFGTEDDAIINITNCYFEEVSNVLRISNRLNAKNVTINLVNCVVDKWESGSAYAGMILCQDYTSGSNESALENNLFAPDKIKINISNLRKPNGEILATDDVATICGTADDNQIIYLYLHKAVVTDLAYFPTITVA